MNIYLLSNSPKRARPWIHQTPPLLVHTSVPATGVSASTYCKVIGYHTLPKLGSLHPVFGTLDLALDLLLRMVLKVALVALQTLQRLMLSSLMRLTTHGPNGMVPQARRPLRKAH